MHRPITTTAMVIGAILITTHQSMTNGDFLPTPAGLNMSRASGEVRFVRDGVRTTPRFPVPTASLTGSQLASITRGTDDGSHLWDWPDA